MNAKTQKITRSAILLALLISLQYLTASFGQLVTGSVVNMILVLSSFMVGGVYSVFIALISPILAFFIGIGPAFLPIVPFISIANALYVLSFSLLKKYTKLKDRECFLNKIMVLVFASLLKFSVLYFGLVKFALAFLGIPEKAKATISVMMGYPQLITATIGGFIALCVYAAVTRSKAA